MLSKYGHAVIRPETNLSLLIAFLELVKIVMGFVTDNQNALFQRSKAKTPTLLVTWLVVANQRALFQISIGMLSTLKEWTLIS